MQKARSTSCRALVLLGRCMSVTNLLRLASHKCQYRDTRRGDRTPVSVIGTHLIPLPNFSRMCQLPQHFITTVLLNYAKRIRGKALPKSSPLFSPSVNLSPASCHNSLSVFTAKSHMSTRGCPRSCNSRTSLMKAFSMFLSRISQTRRQPFRSRSRDDANLLTGSLAG